MDKNEKKEVLKEWILNLKDFKSYKPNLLIKVQDCFVLGVYLDFLPLDNNYKAKFFTHCLLKEFPVISFEMNLSILSRYSFIHKNDNGKIAGFINDFENKNDKVLTEKITPQKLYSLYKRQILGYLSIDTEGGTHPFLLLESLLKIMYYYKEPKNEINILINEFYDFLNKTKHSHSFLWKRDFEESKIKIRITELLSKLENINFEDEIQKNRGILKIK